MEIPSFLEPSERYHRIENFGNTEAFLAALAFSNEFQIDLEAALASVLCAGSHALGGAARLDTSFESIEAPFSLLVATPEPDPLWTSVPTKFLSQDLGEYLRTMMEAYQNERKMQVGNGQTDPAISGISDLRGIAELGQRAFAEGVIERALTNSLSFPFPPSLVDNWVALSTPPIGVIKALAQMSGRERAMLWNALSTERKLSTGSGLRSSGIPAFFWQISHEDVEPLLEAHPWLMDTPMVLMKIQEHEEAPLHSLCKGPQLIANLCRELFLMRLKNMRKAKVFHPGEQDMIPIQKFLMKARAWQRDEIDPELKRGISPRRIVRLAMKLALLHTVIEKEAKMGRTNVDYGLELAKRFTIRNLQTLSVVSGSLPATVTDTTDMSERERSAYLKICRKGRVTPSELSRSFSRMRLDERDEIVASLISKRLISFEDGFLQQGAVQRCSA